MLAVRYCHKFVNTHPCTNGNGRACRLILNAIMVEHVGIVVPLGEKEPDRDVYLAVASRRSVSQQVWENQGIEDIEENGFAPAP
jgi:Fic family protein